MINYDLIIFDLIDASDNVGKANHLYTKKTAKIVKSKLKKDGIFVTMAYEKIKGKWRKSAEYLKEIFKVVRYYGVFVPSFSSYVLFAFAGNKYDPIKLRSSDINKKLNAYNVNVKFYNSITHKLMFSLIF